MIYTVADLSNVWMKANIYEYEMAWIKIGQEVEVIPRHIQERHLSGGFLYRTISG